MPLTPKLQKFSTASQVLVNVDRGDFTTGLGYVEFFCFDAVDNTSIKYNILNKAIRGTNKEVDAGGGGNITISFTTKFGITQIMEGKIYAQFHWAFTGTGGGDSRFATISIEKNDVELGSERGLTVTHSSTTTSTVEVISFDVPNTTFSPGDTFKIKIALNAGGGGSSGAFITFDPLDSSFTPSAGNWTGGAITDTVFKLNIPFLFI